MDQHNESRSHAAPRCHTNASVEEAAIIHVQSVSLALVVCEQQELLANLPFSRKTGLGLTGESDRLSFPEHSAVEGYYSATSIIPRLNVL